MPSAVSKKGSRPTQTVTTRDITSLGLSSPAEAPSREYLQLRKTAATSNNRGINETVEMEVNPDGETFHVFRGATGKAGFVQVGPKAVRKVGDYPMEEWDDWYKRFISQGWTFIPGRLTQKEFTKKISSGFRPIEDASVRQIVSFLMGEMDKMLEETVSVKFADISPEMIQVAQEVLNYMAEHIDDLSVAEFSTLLMKVWTIIPRPIRKMSKEQVLSKTEFAGKLSKEQEIINTLLQMQSATQAESDQRQTILEANGLIWTPVDSDDMSIIKNLLGENARQFSNAWKVTNTAREAAFQAYCEEHKKLSLENGGVTRLFHGSATHNWWSIVKNGLYINPSQIKDLGHKADYHGSAFGPGSYFAPKAGKSLGYTNGGYWNGGPSSSKVYLAIFKVATGEIYDIYGENKGTPRGYEDLQQKHPGADCCWAFSRSKYSNAYLQNEEVIVYRQDQSSIEYLIECDRSYC